MNHEDWLKTQESISNDRAVIRDLSLEEFVSLDVSKKIKNLEYLIEQSQNELNYYKKILPTLPKVPEKLLNISQSLIDEGDYKFRGKRDLQKKLYGRE